MSQDIKQIIREEYLKCAQDPAHFMKKYCYIQHPTRGRIQFNLYPFQEKVLRLWRDNPYDIILKSRQLGISTLVGGYSLWLMLFQKDKNVLCIATKQETAKNMVTKVKFMFENLPSWLKIPAEENNKLTLRLSNGSQVKAVSAAGDAGRSEAVSLLIIDEAAFIDGVEEIWASAQQTLATGGGAIVLSTPYGTGNWFHKTWVKAESGVAEEGVPSFLPIKLPWYVHPERDEKWRKAQDSLLGDPRLAAQECDCDFNTSGDTVFYGEQIEFISTTTIKDPVERRGVDRNLWVWESPDYTRSYMVVADVARGDGKDSSACHVIDIETNAQVAEYKGQLSPREFGYFLCGLATEYNNAMLVVENANMGWSTIEAIQEREYKNLYYSTKSDALTAENYLDRSDDPSKMVAGFTMSLKTRPLVINKFREYIGDKSVVIRSKRLLEEMRVFIWKNGRAEAQSGYNDDLVMSIATAMFVRDTALKYKSQNMDLTRAALSNIQAVRTQFNGAYMPNMNQNPYSVNINGRNEDLSWLL
jgi:phage terminase large subunit GpA-like protein